MRKRRQGGRAEDETLQALTETGKNYWNMALCLGASFMSVGVEDP